MSTDPIIRRHTTSMWYWHRDAVTGAVSLRTPDRGTLVVMDFVGARVGAVPRFSQWRGIDEGQPRARLGGIMVPTLDHPDARLIESSPLLLEAARSALEMLRMLDPGRATDILSYAIKVAEGRDPHTKGTL